MFQPSFVLFYEHEKMLSITISPKADASRILRPVTRHADTATSATAQNLSTSVMIYVSRWRGSLCVIGHI